MQIVSEPATVETTLRDIDITMEGGVRFPITLRPEDDLHLDADEIRR